ncbi:integral membrane sensor domain MASE1 [Kitasatospora sp. MAP12-15]|uniref:MASE1 domain-containing protein n=1 Tax=unclassified Kitasatospora TaxID=2633591 RepID=UPI002476682C|nr:MASE1 domain-containing protein [Kitasatospora sp. MAP12-44]MDH6113692.1 integral membrane sensor domain MASE1 [Kitasatospora sp. MAP12-44]
MAAVLRNEQVRRLATAGLQILAVAAAYLAGGRLGLLQQVVVAGAKVTPLWPPTGIALACLLLLGLRIWPGIALGALLVIITLGPLHPASFAIVAGNTLAPVCACLLLRRVHFDVALERLRDGVALVFLGALGGMLISSTIGTAALLLDDTVPLSAFWQTWSPWWTGDAMGVLLVTPLLLTLYSAVRQPPEDIGPLQYAELAGLLIATATVTVLVTSTVLDLLFLVFPILIWAALRFELVGGTPCALLMSVLTIVAATDHRGPFEHHGYVAVMVILQALNGSAALSTLLLAAVVAERKSTYRRIQDACIALAEVVARLAPAEDPPRRTPEDG